MSSAWSATGNAISTMSIIATNGFRVQSPPNPVSKKREEYDRRGRGFACRVTSAVGESKESAVTDVGKDGARLSTASFEVLSLPDALLSKL